MNSNDKCEAKSVDTPMVASDRGPGFNAKAMLRDRIARMRETADHLQALHDALPEKLPPLAADALHGLLVSYRGW